MSKDWLHHLVHVVEGLVDRDDGYDEHDDEHDDDHGR